MKSILLFFILFWFSYLLSYSQTNLESKKIKNELLDTHTKPINDVENKLILFDTTFIKKLNTLTQTIDSINKSINDTRLRESLKSAENTINFQNSFIYIFEALFAALALLVGFTYFFSIRPLLKQADEALDRANDATDKFENKIIEFDKQVDNKINTRFDLFEKTLKEKEIKEIFEDIESNLPNQRRLQIERLTKGNIDLTSEKIDRLFKVLDSSKLSEDEKSIIIEVLIQLDTTQIQRYLESWKNVKNEEIKLINTLYYYYMNKGFGNYLTPITSYILNRIEPHLEFNRLLDMLPSHRNDIILLINCKTLINSLSSYSKESVIAHINESISSLSLVESKKVSDSFLFQRV